MKITLTWIIVEDDDEFKMVPPKRSTVNWISRIFAIVAVLTGMFLCKWILTEKWRRGTLNVDTVTERSCRRTGSSVRLPKVSPQVWRLVSVRLAASSWVQSTLTSCFVGALSFQCCFSRPEPWTDFRSEKRWYWRLIYHLAGDFTSLVAAVKKRCSDSELTPAT